MLIIDSPFKKRIVKVFIVVYIFILFTSFFLSAIYEYKSVSTLLFNIKNDLAADNFRRVNFLVNNFSELSTMSCIDFEPSIVDCKKDFWREWTSLHFDVAPMTIGSLPRKFTIRLQPLVPFAYGTGFFLLLAMTSFPIISIIRTMIEENAKFRRDSEIESAKVIMARQVAHDIRSPVAAINMAVDHLKSSPNSPQAIEVIEAARDRMNSISEELLQNYRRENQKFLVRDVLSDALNELKLVKGQGKEIKIDLKFENEVALVGNRSLFLNSVFNILSNSYDAIVESGNIFIRAFVEEGLLTLEIIDTGCGIPKNILNRLGNECITFGKKNGTGIGISSAIEGLGKMGGKLKLDSIEGKGTTARILVPV